MSKVKVTETILRDAHQSLIATRMTTEEMIPTFEMLDKVGYESLECWGGATFDACLRFLNEDPWERLRIMKNSIKNTKLQMLFRGQNILGYRHYSDDVVEYFVRKSIANGIDIIRIFDALNDPRNLQTAIKATIKEGGHVQAAMSYTISPVHTTDKFVELAKQLEEMGANSICVKDMAGLLTPFTTYELIKKLKDSIKLPIQLHTHYTTGMASMSMLKAIEAGVDVIDTALSPFALGTSQPATEVMVAALKGTQFDTGLDLNLLSEISKFYAPLREKYIASGMLSPKALAVDANCLLYQLPGGMISNLISQLKDAGKEDKFNDVLSEVPKVRLESGYPPLVTPTSQIVGSQAVLNVIGGERYKLVSKEFKALVRGEYGKTPAPIDPLFRKKIIGDEEPIDCRPADLLSPELDKLRAEIAQYIEQDEDVLSYALFEKVALKFFEYRKAQKYKIDIDNVDMKNKVHPV